MGTKEAVGAHGGRGDVAEDGGQPRVALAAALVLLPAGRLVNLRTELAQDTR